MYGYWIVWALKSGPPNYILALILELDPDGVKTLGSGNADFLFKTHVQ
jgi:hypothetical protein